MISRLLLIPLASALLACSPGIDSVDEGLVDLIIDGSSTVYPIMMQAARLYASADPDASIAVSFSGTTAGFRRFCDGEIHISAASREMDASEISACADSNVEYERFDLGTDAIALVTHPRNGWLSSITLDELRLMWSLASEGEISKWRDVNASWPDTSLNLYGRGQDSGTYDYFTSQVTGQVRSSRMDYAASEDEEWLAAEIAADQNAFGFFGLGAYHRHWDVLRLVALDAGSGSVYPSLETASAGTYQPLTRPLFLYVRSDVLGHETADSKPATHFLHHLFSNIGSWMHFTGYLPLSNQNYQDSVRRLDGYFSPANQL
ncbi:MAG: PstS family phosphate ABC transporter substrate-binding protein [Pseudohongiella sp.]|nr:PstS family phosphate ABC transporter substrate-binding protein [Pseudohongiella sp.]MDP2128492.1 PstS family phosphate ABC transporter substrate-binding protein [Pseudohongiella sp.]